MSFVAEASACWTVIRGATDVQVHACIVEVPKTESVELGPRATGTGVTAKAVPSVSAAASPAASASVRVGPFMWSLRSTASR